MANGDIAVAEAGKTAVKATDDFRLGYDRINEAMDLGVQRGIRSFPTKAAMDAVPGLFYGAYAVVSGTKVTYYWNGAAWRPWASPWMSYTPTVTGASLGTGATTALSWRWENGRVRVKGDLAQGSGSAITGQVNITLPVNSNENYRPLGVLYVIGGGATFACFVQSDAPNSNKGYLLVNVTSSNYAYSTPLANNQPRAATQSDVWHFDLLYEAYDFPVANP